MRDREKAPLDYAAPSMRSPLLAMNRRTRWAIGGCFAVAFLCLSLYALAPTDAVVRDDRFEVVQVRMLHPHLQKTLPWLLLVGFVLPLIASVLLLRRRRALVAVLLPVGTIVASVVAFGMGMTRSFGRWTVCDEIIASEGANYCFIDHSFLQAQTMAIARPRPAGLFRTTFDVLGTNNGDSPRSYLMVVRPTPPKPVKYGALYAAPEGLLVGVRHDNLCYLVYDVEKRRFYGHGDVEKLSPFLLLDETSQLLAADEAAILGKIGGATVVGLPTRESLEAALNHPNAAVRQSAAKLLQAMKR